MKDITYAAPKTIAEATGLLNDKGDRARILAGGTDIIVQVREGRRDIDALVDVKHIAEVNELTCDAKGLVIGAAVPCCVIYENKAIAKAYPGLMDAVTLIGGIQIQSRASLGGNLCNASPAADSIPVLIALEGTCEIAGPKGNRSVPVEQFCTAPGKTVLGRGEFLVRFRFPPPKPHSGAAYLRFIPRNEMDIAVVGAGVAVQLDGSKCKSARIALAAVAPTPLLVADAGAALVGTTLDDAAIAKAAAIAQAAAKPISDMRGDADYRRHLVGVLVKRSLAIAIDRAKP
ncbi:MAG: xanthine dehydrogenase family protein subunit M [Planctomycetes bacterium]|nr:xanthine dehydrogenase family protein subunit M [Planctomycetota bacterium]